MRIREEKEVTHSQKNSSYFYLFVQGPWEMPIILLEQNRYLSCVRDIFFLRGPEGTSVNQKSTEQMAMPLKVKINK